MGVEDEYFYDLGHQLLEDRGNQSALSGGFPHPEDDYIWLDGRPIAYVRGQIQNVSGTWERSSDATANCQRMWSGSFSDNLPCGIYFVVTDHIGKPILSLNQSQQISGLYDYDLFGSMNRQDNQSGGFLPEYGGTGSNNCTATSGENVTGNITQRPAADGMKVDMRVRFHGVDTESVGGSPFGSYPPTATQYPLQYAMIRDGDTDYCFTDAGTEVIGGWHAGQVITPWYTPDAGYLQVLAYAPSTSYCPDGGGGYNTGCTSYAYKGLMTEAADYREYQVGATPLMLPLRFPGQYYDQETDLVENWNRMYDPSVGRYLEVEPKGMEPDYTEWVTSQGLATPPVYAYAADNPVAFSDPDGRSYLAPSDAACAKAKADLDRLTRRRDNTQKEGDEHGCHPTKDHPKKIDQLNNAIQKAQKAVERLCKEKPNNPPIIPFLPWLPNLPELPWLPEPVLVP